MISSGCSQFARWAASTVTILAFGIKLAILSLPHPRQPAATNPETVRKPGPRKALRQAKHRHKTGRANRDPPGNQATQDRSGLPTEQHSQLHGASERFGRGVSRDD